MAKVRKMKKETPKEQEQENKNEDEKLPARDESTTKKSNVAAKKSSSPSSHGTSDTNSNNSEKTKKRRNTTNDTYNSKVVAAAKKLKKENEDTNQTSSSSRPLAKKTRAGRRSDDAGQHMAETLEKGVKKESQEGTEDPAQRHEANQEEESNLQILIERLRHSYNHNGGENSNESLFDETRARNLLEAAGGNLDLAVMLHWEDLAVSHCSSNHEDHNHDHASGDNAASASSNRRSVRFSQRGRQEENAEQENEAHAAREQENAEAQENNAPNEEEHLVEERVVDSNSVSISDDEGASSSTNNASSRFLFHLFDEEIEEMALSSNSNRQQNRLSMNVGNEEDIFEFNAASDMHSTPSNVVWGSNSIPQTWLQCGFTLSTLGLVAPKPANPTSRNKLKITHCPGVTALLSIVTALLQSNACIQGRSVHCTISRKRFSDLKNDEERRRLFHNRLADALSSILYVAAKSKADDLARYKQKIQNNAKAAVVSDDKVDGKSSVNVQRRQALQHLFKVQSSICPVCTWKKEPSNDNNADNNRRAAIGEFVSTSKTNINDLRAFAFSHIRSFTAKGGIALFLEIICRIHGTKRIQTMLRKAGSKASSLINCSCCAKTAKNNKSHQQLTHACLSTELLSLILSSTVHTSLQGWNANNFGIGLLSSSSILSPKTHTVDPALLNPKKSIWIIMGEQYYSSMWLKGQDNDTKKDIQHSNANIDTTSALNKNTAFYITHWDCIKGVDTNMRIFPTNNNNNALQLPIDKKANKISLDVKCHEDDAKYYKEYIRWRFSFSDNVYKPYFQLSEKEKYLVDLKYCPKIQLVLWSRWNGAVVDDFSDGCPPVV